MQPHAVIRCDASPLIGGGHATRCLALAQAFATAGWHVTFAVGPLTLSATPWLGRSGFEVAQLGPSAAAEPAQLRHLFPQGCDALVVDHYQRDRTWETGLRGWASRILVIDDATGRTHDCDVLVDSGASVPGDYAGLVPARALVLLGPQYALLREGFRQARSAALERRLETSPVRNMLVSFGSTDPADATSATLAATKGLLPEVTSTVVLASMSPHLDRVRGLLDRSTRLIVDSDDMPALMTAADIAIGAAGSTSFERAILGLPTLAVMLADNQKGIHELLIDQGAALDLGRLDDRYPARLEAALRALVADAGMRADLSKRACALVDGRGAERVVASLEATTANERRAP